MNWDERFEQEVERMARIEKRVRRNDRILYLVLAVGIAIVVGAVIGAYWF